MAYNRYPSDNGESNSYSSAIYYAMIVAVSIILIWIAWAILIYKYSIGRIGNLMVVAYGNKHSSLSNNYITYENLVITPDKTKATAIIVVKNPTTLVDISRESFSCTLSSKCTLGDYTCITV